MCGLILKEITCRVRIYHPRRVPVCINKVRGHRQNLEIEVSRRRCSGRARQIERRASSDWLRVRAPLVTLVTCRRQVSSIYRTVHNRSRSECQCHFEVIMPLGYTLCQSVTTSQPEG